MIRLSVACKVTIQFVKAKHIKNPTDNSLPKLSLQLREQSSKGNKYMNYKNQKKFNTFRREDVLVWKHDDGAEQAYIKIEAVNEVLSKREEEVKSLTRADIIASLVIEENSEGVDCKHWSLKEIAEVIYKNKSQSKKEKKIYGETIKNI